MSQKFLFKNWKKSKKCLCYYVFMFMFLCFMYFAIWFNKLISYCINMYLLTAEAVVWRCSVKKMFLEISKKETLAQVFSYEFCEISKNTFFHRTLLTLLSMFWQSHVVYFKPWVMSFLFMSPCLFPNWHHWL